LVRPPRLLGFGGRPYNFFERDAIQSNLSNVLVRAKRLSFLHFTFALIIVAEAMLNLRPRRGEPS
jgi:hypothetical protein